PAVLQVGVRRRKGRPRARRSVRILWTWTYTQSRFPTPRRIAPTTPRSRHTRCRSHPPKPEFAGASLSTIARVHFAEYAGLSDCWDLRAQPDRNRHAEPRSVDRD